MNMMRHHQALATNVALILFAVQATTVFGLDNDSPTLDPRRDGSPSGELAIAVQQVQLATASVPGWEDYLHLADLDRVATGIRSTDLPLLEATVKRLTQDQPGFAMMPLVQLRKVCQRLSINLRANQEFSQEELARANQIASFSGQNGSSEPEDLAHHYAALRWLRERGLPPPEILTPSPDRANFLFWQNAENFRSEASSSCTCLPISGCLCGTPYQGKARSCQSSTVASVLSDHSAKLSLQLSGHSHATTTSRSEGVVLKSNSNLTYEGQAFLSLTPEGWNLVPFEFSGNYQSYPTSIHVEGNKLFKSHRRNLARQGHAKAKGAAKRQGMQEVRSSATNELTRLTKRLNVSREDLKKRLLRLGLAVTHENYSSDEQGLSGSMRASVITSLLAPPPTMVKTGSSCLCIHETVANELLAMALPTGPTSLDRVNTRLSGSRPAEADDTLMLNLPPSHSIEFFFRNGSIKVLLHTLGLEAEERKYAASDLMLVLVPEEDGHLVRRDRVQMVNTSSFPPQKKLGLRDVSARRIVGNILSKKIASRWDMSTLLSAMLGTENDSSLKIRNLYPENGWLMIVFEVSN